MANLTSAQIKNWQTKIDKSIKTDLVKLMSNTAAAASQLAKITKSDDATLSQRYTDLQRLTTQAQKQLTTFMTSFDTSIKSYINNVEKATAVATEETHAAIDQFAEKATQIARLKM